MRSWISLSNYIIPEKTICIYLTIRLDIYMIFKILEVSIYI
jgi:hypothetical protein